MINAPTVINLSAVYGATWADRWDLNGTFAWDEGTETTGNMEVWLKRDADADFSMVATVGLADRAFTIAHFSPSNPYSCSVQVKLRWHNYLDAPGPFSNVYSVMFFNGGSSTGGGEAVATVLLTKEDGSGSNIANSYANVADADAYHLGHLYASAWDTDTDTKKAALIMATRLIDTEYQFGGRLALTGQALQWPRIGCPEPDGFTLTFDQADYYTRVANKITITDAGVGQIRILTGVKVVPENVIPKAVVMATIELARELIVSNRTAAPPGEGIASTEQSLENSTTGTSTVSGSKHVQSSKTVYSKSDTPPIIPRLVQAMLAKYGTMFSAKSGVSRLVRV